MMNHVMLDLETLDTKTTAVFPSLAAIPFDIETGEMRKPFYQKITIQSALGIGLTIGADTIQWWMSQLLFELRNQLQTYFLILLMCHALLRMLCCALLRMLSG